MTRNWAFALLAFVVAAVVVAGQALYVVDQSQQAIVLRLGVPARTVNAAGQDGAGLQVKLPFAETVVRFDRQSQALEIDGQDMRAGDQQHLTVDAVLRYRIVDPLVYLRSLVDDQGARARLTPLIAGALRERIGGMKSGDVIAGGRDQVTGAALSEIAARVKAAKIGVAVVDLSLKRVRLPSADEAVIYQRMKAQRQAEAVQIKTQGETDIAAARATGDKNADVVRAAGQQEAGRIMGEGDARRAALFAQAYGRDPEFADFYRHMQAYEKTMGSDTTVMLSSDSAFLKYFKSGPGR